MMRILHAGVIGAALLLVAACGGRQAGPPAAGVPAATPTNEAATLGSLQQVDDYPLYTMHYRGSYPAGAALPHIAGTPDGARQAWGCSLFAALGDENDRLLGRNFDWQLSPALLLFTEPEDGYASVSMVDISYLGFEGERSRHLLDLSLEERRPLLDSPSLPFDGMNEKGIAVGMAAVPRETMPNDPQHATIDELEAIREILDHAATVDEAVAVLGSYNIDMGNVPIHYLIASAAGQSALVEFYRGEMVVFRNEQAWQAATNFLVASTGGEPGGQCPRYDRISRRMENLEGQIASADAMDLLSSVSQENTQWSIVYHVTSGDIQVVMGRGHAEAPHTFHLQPASE